MPCHVVCGLESFWLAILGQWCVVYSGCQQLLRQEGCVKQSPWVHARHQGFVRVVWHPVAQ